MGAPKQKWTAEEESALKAGVAKHGTGKWRTILKDPEFSGILCLRSNVDLKDKWRNMTVTANGWGSREKARAALKKNKQISQHDDNPMALSTVVKDIDDEIVDIKPLAMSSESLQIAGPKGSNSRLENLILEAIIKLKEPTGSHKTAIAMYLEDALQSYPVPISGIGVVLRRADGDAEMDQYWLPPDFKRLLSAKLKALTTIGKLTKVKRKYRIAPSSSFSEGKNSKVLLTDGKRRETSRLGRDDIKPLTKSQVDAELAQMRYMTPQEAAVAAAQAVAEAEAAMAEAEAAAREAEAAEADAEAAQAVAEAAMLTLKNRNAAKMMFRV